MTRALMTGALLWDTSSLRLQVDKSKTMWSACRTMVPENQNPYWGDLEQLRADVKSLEAQLAEEKANVARLEQEKKDLIKQNEQEKKDLIKQISQYKVDLYWEKGRHAELKAARDKEENKAWEREMAAHREKKAREEAVIAAQKAREEAVIAAQKAREEAARERSRTQTAAEKLEEFRARREREAKADVFAGVAIHRDPADDEYEAQLVAAAEREAAEEEETPEQRSARELEEYLDMCRRMDGHR